MPDPTTLEEAIIELDSILGDEDRAHVRTLKDEGKVATALHHTLGRHLRNQWGLWRSSALAQHLRDEHRITHPDDMSHFIIVAYCRRQIPNRFQRILSG